MVSLRIDTIERFHVTSRITCDRVVVYSLPAAAFNCIGGRGSFDCKSSSTVLLECVVKCLALSHVPYDSLCVVVGCSKRSGRARDVSFY